MLLHIDIAERFHCAQHEPYQARLDAQYSCFPKAFPILRSMVENEMGSQECGR